MAERRFSEPPTLADAVVVVLAHGSESASTGADRARECADEVAGSGRFHAVRAAFLRDTPSPAEVVREYPDRDIFVVPFMAGEGHSLERLIPDALGADTPKRVRVCRPVGSHPWVEAWAIDRLADLAADRDMPPTGTSVLVVAHGTPRNPDNADRARRAVRAIARRGLAEGVDSVFLDQEPRVDSWRQRVRPGHVLVFPYLMALGSHARFDIPEALGIPGAGIAETLSGMGIAGPFASGEHTIYYGPLLGSCPLLPDIVAERIAEHAD